jgi:hypothetical protein
VWGCWPGWSVLELLARFKAVLELLGRLERLELLDRLEHPGVAWTGWSMLELPDRLERLELPDRLEHLELLARLEHLESPRSCSVWSSGPVGASGVAGPVRALLGVAWPGGSVWSCRTGSSI